ncbi:helix-turn-helix domain-containing protein [Rhodococcus qingshengii]|uniref:helix-turn-helix domain-containing protein n=1 Tax=Rhodococcus qingshengii TaxID=334542 RepID=UPI000AA878AE|nr:helix-turn-helix domain-containing protein [Rhodococcus qingshengii]
MQGAESPDAVADRSTHARRHRSKPQENGGDKQAPADALGMSRATIYRKIGEFGINL